MDKNHKIGGFSHFLIFLQTNQKLAGSALRPFGASASSAPTWAPGRGVGGLTACSCSPSDPPPLACSVLAAGVRLVGQAAASWTVALAHWRLAPWRGRAHPGTVGRRCASGERTPVPRCLALAAMTPPVRDPAARGSTR